MHERKIDPAIEQRSIRCSSIRGVDLKSEARIAA